MKRSLQQFLELPDTTLSFFQKTWLLAPLAVWFSYRPLIRLGQNSTMYFELSITLLYLLALALSGLPIIWRHKQSLVSYRSVQLVTAFVALSGLSLLWTPNLTRGFLTLGIIGLLYSVFLASVAARKDIQKLLPALCNLFVVSAVVMSLVALIQLFAGIWFNQQETLLCGGCTALQFGFARPTGFAIEPQFFGNLLLVPMFILLHRILTKKATSFTTISFIIILLALFLTLSRGAIFAGGIGTLLLFVVTHPRPSRALQAIGLALISFVVCLLLQGTVAALNPHVSTSFRGAVSASINQLSLGAITLPAIQPASSPSTPAAPTTQEVATNYTGYVAESTNVRLNLSSLAIQSWQQTPGRMLFGVGLGGSGLTLHQDYPNEVRDREIVQNEFLEILLENGLVGWILFMAILVALLIKLRVATWCWAIVIAFMMQWNFFSGYPNALHIYLTFIILATIITFATPKRKATQN